MSLGFLSEWGAAAECRATRLWAAASTPARASPTLDCSPCRWLRSRSSPVSTLVCGYSTTFRRDGGARYITRPPPRPVRLLRAPPDSTHPITVQKRCSREGRHVAAQTLRTLIAALPLDAPPLCCPARHSALDNATPSQGTDQGEMFLTPTADISSHGTHVPTHAECAPPRTRRASVAVQASLASTENPDYLQTESSSPGGGPRDTDTRPDPTDACDDECKNATWRHGVRALRDAHMRLARRHLRLLDTLSRALDPSPRAHRTRASANKLRL
ncbi:uncharacterized protein LOC101741565 isoform X2 [Bombyx mori]|uniref:Uncharacterized protein n=1 Tax=Bombyx mori TaxID=7091 RepID=A0A8R2HQG3_BOMMO|nr:uncharacterized protein LOC101741565 isoform X3 [Bombyx mori]